MWLGIEPTGTASTDNHGTISLSQYSTLKYEKKEEKANS